MSVFVGQSIGSDMSAVKSRKGIYVEVSFMLRQEEEHRMEQRGASSTLASSSLKLREEEGAAAGALSVMVNADNVLMLGVSPKKNHLFSSLQTFFFGGWGRETCGSLLFLNERNRPI
jgi:hypothetical protein